MAYPTDDLDLRGPALPWSALAWAGVLTLAGLGLAVGADQALRARSRRRRALACRPA